MNSNANDPVDRIMEVMEVSFDAVWGEAWSRRQVGDALVMGNCRFLLIDAKGAPHVSGPTAGFLLSRRAADEEELLLIAVRPELRRRGLAAILIERFVAEARLGGVARVFLEMRDGNPAAELYLRHGFDAVGRRANYYNRGQVRGIDAITFARELEDRAP